MRRLAQQARWCRSLSHRLIQPRNGPARCEGQLSSLMRTIIWWTSRWASSWMSKASRANARQRLVQPRTMIERTAERFEIKPIYLAADTAYASAESLNWIVQATQISPHITLL